MPNKQVSHPGWFSNMKHSNLDSWKQRFCKKNTFAVSCLSARVLLLQPCHPLIPPLETPPSTFCVVWNTQAGHGSFRHLDVHEQLGVLPARDEFFTPPMEPPQASGRFFGSKLNMTTKQLPSLKLRVRTWKWMVGIMLVFFLGPGLLSG